MIPVARPALSQEELHAVADVFDSRWLGQGKVTTEFERAVGELVARPHVVATNTGTSAIQLGLEAVGIGAGDDVVLPALTFVATAQAIAATGARAVLCDVDQETMNMDLASLEAAATPQTKAVVPVHYRGLPVEIDPIVEWARERGARVVEDAAHAFGSTYEDGVPVGGKGDVTCFSFDPIKNVTAGEGGCVVFSDEDERVRAGRMRNLGTDSTAWSRLSGRHPWSYDVVEPGWRFHMPNFCAAIGLSQLQKLDHFRRRKQEVLERYQAEFRDHADLTMSEMPVERCFPFLALVLVEEREALMAHLKERGVGSGVHYIPVHHFTRFAEAARGPLPATDHLAARICTLPLLNDQTEEELETVVDAVRSFSASEVAGSVGSARP